MAATAWTITQSDLVDGVIPNFQAIDSANGNKFANNGKIRLRFRGAVSATGQATVVAQTKCNHGTLHNVVTPASALDTTAEEIEIGPFPIDRFNDANSDVNVTYSGTVTGITCSVVRDA